MIKLRTEIEHNRLKQLIAPGDNLFFVGSCFTDHIGSWLGSLWLPVTCNPWGVLFNPASIARSLSRAASPDRDYSPPVAPDVQSGIFYSFDHHGQFSSPDREALISQIADAESQASAQFSAARHVFVTLGTAWVYEHDGQVVANCHKFPASQFTRRMLSVDEIVTLFLPLIGQKHWLFTVSPIRHVRDGLHANQLSKATLLLAIHRLCEQFPGQVEYVPVYELFLDDLRDYRFYADDLVHPSSQGVMFVRQLLSDCCFSDSMRSFVAEAESIRRAFGHRPSNPGSPGHQEFLRQTQLRLERLQQKSC